MSSSKTPMDKELEALVSEYSPHIKTITVELRNMAVKTTPGSCELIYHGALGYSLTKSPFDRIIYILPSTNHVTFGFFYGTDLPDPTRLLTGEGKRMRHVKVNSVEEARNPDLEKLAIAAWAGAAESVSKVRNGLKKSRPASTKVWVNSPKRASR